ncbi:MAG TPA: acetate--CoA ligase family protein, partial [Mycobacterium sp.]|nr:acetate--CoA ligase family protein [Mycobacterium sp.]
MTWSSWLRDRSSATVESDETTPVEPSQGIWSEAESLNLFSSLGVPTLPFEIAASGEEAVQAAERLGYPVVAKIASAQISHKTDIGGVQLDLRSREEVAAAFDKLIQAGELHAEATVDGVLIAPMQPEGLDLIVGALRDPQWGLLILIGLGGVHAEAMKVQATRLLPATRQDIVTMLEQLSVPSLLSGLRATEPPTMSQVVDAISAFARFASRAGTPLVSAEINPLRLASSRVAALDGLIEWA